MAGSSRLRLGLKPVFRVDQALCRSRYNSRMITNIQALRGLAALAVVLLHTEYKLFGVVSTQFQGVSIFFVISGFIVAYITKSGMDGFMIRRIMRIVPIYWAVTIFAFFWLSLDQFGWLWWILHDPMQAYRQADNVFRNSHAVVDALRSMFFLPYRDASSGDYGSFLFVGWTLNIEFFFYVLFAVFGIVGRRIAMVGVFLVFLVLAWLHATTTLGGALVRFYGQSVSLYIPTGFAVYAIWEWARPKLGSVYWAYLAVPAALVGVLVILLNCAQLWYPGISGNLLLMVLYYLLPALVVLAALCLHTGGIRCNWRPLLVLGDISYVLYLSHVLVLTTVSRYAQSYPALNYKSGAPGMMLAMVLCCLVAWLLHVAVEKPLLKFGKWLVERRPVAGAVAIGQ